MGNRSLQEAQDLALTLRAGALPIPLKIVEERQVGASLGQGSIRQGITAGIVGTALVVLIMIGYDRLSGVLAVLALVLYILFTFGGLAALDATLTLPGLAGLVLTVGIAVDSNVATVLTALFLFQFGTGPVKGFAVTLIMGIAASMITAVFVTRTFYLAWLRRRPD